jgi:hypothetical protein
MADKGDVGTTVNAVLLNLIEGEWRRGEKLAVRTMVTMLAALHVVLAVIGSTLKPGLFIVLALLVIDLT